MSILNTLTTYMKEKQPLGIRLLHVFIILFVFSQIITSELVEFDDNGYVSGETLDFLGSWAHFSIGLLLIPITILFVISVFRRHGFAYFYPYLFGDFTQIKADLKQAKQFQIPEPKPRGIAAVAQGMGLGILVLVLLAAVLWFVSWQLNPHGGHLFMRIHTLLVNLLILYVIGHGFMGIVHIFFKGSLNKSHKIM